MEQRKEAIICLEGLGKQFQTTNGTVTALDDINLEILQGEIFGIIGLSGAGKSTLVRCINYLETPTAGRVIFEGQNLSMMKEAEIRKARQSMGMIFQQFNLLAQRNVLQNVCFPMEIAGVPKAEAKKRAAELLKLVGLEERMKAYPAQLSGGQKQRVAIGAAIVRQPKAFLMDEPLSNLDAKLRGQMRVELQKLHKQLNTTIIYVTHDQTEAMTLGTKIVVMKDGLIQQVDTPQQIYDNPINKFVAGFVGSPSMNFIECDVSVERERTALIFAGTGPIRKVYLTGQNARRIGEKYDGRRVILGIRPEDIYEEAEAIEGDFAENSVDVEETIVTREMLGSEVILYFDEQQATCAVRLKPTNQTQAGEKIRLYFDMDRAHVFDMETEENLLYRKEW